MRRGAAPGHLISAPDVFGYGATTLEIEVAFQFGRLGQGRADGL